MMRFHQTTLPNGLEIIAETNSAAHSAAVGFFVKTGARDETDTVAGVSHFLEHMLFKGTASRSAEQVNRELDEMGASSNAFTSEEQTVYYASVLPELLDHALDLLGDLMRPALREDDFEMEKQVILEEIKMYEDQPPFGADEKSRELFFAGHPLGRSILGTVESITGLTAGHMRAYHEARYAPENIVLIGTGRLEFERFVEKAASVCASWTSSFSPLSSPSVSLRENGFHRTLSRVFGKSVRQVIRKETLIQQYLVLLSNAPAAADPDREAAALLANALGDDVGSRLYWELVDNGRADSAWLGLYEFLDAGIFMTVMSSPPESAVENARLLHRLYADLKYNPITAEEMDRSKSKMLSRIVLANECPRGRLFTLGNEWMMRGRYRTVHEEMDDLRQVSLAEVHAVRERYPLTDPLVLSVEKGSPTHEKS